MTLEVKDSWGHWSINGRSISEYLGKKIKQGSEVGVLRHSHTKVVHAQGGPDKFNNYVLVTEDFRLVPFKTGKAYLETL
jgi:hypothetical protein